jgi:hypothetical protein
LLANNSLKRTPGLSAFDESLQNGRAILHG